MTTFPANSRVLYVPPPDDGEREWPRVALAGRVVREPDTDGWLTFVVDAGPWPGELCTVAVSCCRRFDVDRTLAGYLSGTGHAAAVVSAAQLARDLVRLARLIDPEAAREEEEER